MGEEYISRDAAIAAACYGFCHPGMRCPDTPCRDQTKYLRELPPADVLPYTLDHDGTMTITVPKGMAVGRVFVQRR